VLARSKGAGKWEQQAAASKQQASSKQACKQQASSKQACKQQASSKQACKQQASSKQACKQQASSKQACKQHAAAPPAPTAVAPASAPSSPSRPHQKQQLPSFQPKRNLSHATPVFVAQLRPPRSCSAAGQHRRRITRAHPRPRPRLPGSRAFFQVCASSPPPPPHICVMHRCLARARMRMWGQRACRRFCLEPQPSTLNPQPSTLTPFAFCQFDRGEETRGGGGGGGQGGRDKTPSITTIHP